jgi:hypothetical protein
MKEMHVKAVDYLTSLKGSSDSAVLLPELQADPGARQQAR